jgi:hypothetical protein
MISLLNDLELLLINRKRSFNRQKINVLFRALHNLPMFII